MKMYVFSVFDKAVNAYNTPFYARTTQEAIRSFGALVNDTKTNVAQHPSDFVLFLLGEYDDNSGLFSCAEPRRIVGATELVADLAGPLSEMKAPA